MREPVIEFRDVGYGVAGKCEVLANLSFEVFAGEILVLLGRSGSGKTTALKLVNKLLTNQQGDIRIEGRSIREWDVIQLRRHIGYAIQEVGLFPHYTIGRNIGLVPEIEEWTVERIRGRVGELLKLMGLPEEVRARYPHQLSGGQRQRVGVARALAADPPILLMDEPFGALDPITRADLQRDFLSLQRKLQKTVLFVTHDLHEAMLLGTKIALLEAGRLVSLTSTAEFVKSSDPFVRKYLQAFETAPNGHGQGRA